ncbi:MAG TPA: YvcK family protein [Firmicutes bacterium]|nr:YvcK family protein [Bacillota bacterium]
MSFKVIKWLYPGMRVKRWVFLLVLGILAISGGLALLLGWEVLSTVEQLFVRRLQALFGRQPAFVPSLAGLFLIAAGIVLVCAGVRQTVRTLLRELAPRDVDNVADIMFARRNLRRGPHVVALGGGTGLSTLLRGMKEYTSNITAIVTVADDGGSSGVLRAELGMLPPGDIRNTLVALADTEPLMQQLFQYRFPQGNGLAGHSFGNLFIAAMHQITGDFEGAVRESSKVLAIRGRVLPSTLDPVVLQAEYTDGDTITGESRIPQPGKRIRKVSICPADAAPLDEALRAIAAADIIILGPGSLYTSVMPNLLVRPITAAIRESAAIKIYVCNVMTQPGETSGYSAADHLQAIFDHAGPGLVHYCLANNAPISEAAAERYRRRGAHPVAVDAGRLQKLGVTPVVRSLISETDVVRHDPQKLARAVLEVAGLWRPPVK